MSDLINSASSLPFNAKKSRVRKMQAVDMPFFLYVYGLVSEKYKWSGWIEDSAWLLEEMLFFNGLVVFFKFGESFTFLPCYNSGETDAQGQIVKVRPIAFNSYNPSRRGDELPFDLYVKDEYDRFGNLTHKQDAVLIKNNDWGLSTYFYIYPFIEQIKYTMQSKTINQVVSRLKWLIKGDKDSIKALVAQMETTLDSAKPYLAVYTDVNAVAELGDLSGQSSETFNPDCYWQDIDKTINFLLTILGINNNLETKKKARLNVAEVKSNDEVVDISNNIWLRPRQIACKQAREVLGVDISCVASHEQEMVEGGGCKEVNHID